MLWLQILSHVMATTESWLEDKQDLPPDDFINYLLITAVIYAVGLHLLKANVLLPYLLGSDNQNLGPILEIVKMVIKNIHL